MIARKSTQARFSRALPASRSRLAAILSAVLTTILGIAGLGAGAVLLTPSPAASAETSTSPASDAPDAAPEATPTAPATPTTPTTPAAPAAPTITSPADGAFIGEGSVTVSGTRAAGQTIHLLSPTGGDPLCIREPDGSSTWSCPATLESSPSVVLRVVDAGDVSLSSTATVRVLVPPRITGGALSTVASNGMVRGTGYPGAAVKATLSNGAVCAATADSSGAWACYFQDLHASGTYAVAARQSTDYSSPSSSASSAPVRLLFDLDRPAPPTLTSPANNSRVSLSGTTYAGKGEPGATVTVFADAYSLCTALVDTDGSWSCFTDGVPAGSYSVRTLQQDEAGNVGPASPAAVIAYGPAPVAPPPAASDDTPAEPAPAVPVPAAGPTPAPEPSESAPGGSALPEGEGSPEAQAPLTPEPPRDPGARANGPVAGGWNDPTGFAAAVARPGSEAATPWWQAVLMAVGAILLVAVPARLLAVTISRARNGRPVWSARLAGRNRARTEFESPPQLRVHRSVLAGAALAAAAALVMLSGPVTDQPAYLRLLVAVVVALVVVNAVGVLIPVWWGRRILRVDASPTFLPRYLLLVAVTALGSRVLDLQPAVLFGLLGSVALGETVQGAARGKLAAVRAGSLVALALTSWAILGLIPAGSGFVPALTAEALNTIVLAGLGSAALVLIPTGWTSGRSILAWSPAVWAALAVTAFTSLFGVLSPTMDPGGATLLGAAVGVFAATGIGAWAWSRFVGPALG